ncbi:MAG: metal ABC transporter substrate-binding protein [Chloroflexi bacterium]|nr:metal ABC transporter substrate-binding protein [Chloroflexota bacterium]
MSRLFRLTLSTLIALSLAAALVVGCSDDEQAQQQAQSQPAVAQPQEQQEQSGDAAEEPAEPISVVVSTQVIADWVRQVGGDLVDVRALVPAGADAHTLELTVDDIRAIADADLVIINGAGLEATYADAILENTDSLLDLAEALEAAGLELQPFEGMMSLEDEHDHQQHQQDHEQHEQDEHDHDDDQQHQQDHEQHEQDEHDHDDDQQHQQDHDQHEQDEHDHDDDQQHQQGHDQHEQEEHDDHDQHDHEQDEHDHDDDQQQQQGHDQHEQEEHEQHDQDEHGQDEHAHAHDHSGEDPHYWFDTDLAQAAVEVIADSLIELLPSAEAEISTRTEAYAEEIREADAEVRSLLEDLPDHQRLLVTFHDAFGYFARRYGLQVAGFVVEGPEQGVSAETLTRLIELIEHEGVQTVFHEPQFDSTILDTIASETGAERGIIWSQPTEDNPTYIGILVGNAKALADQ